MTEVNISARELINTLGASDWARFGASNGQPWLSDSSGREPKFIQISTARRRNLPPLIVALDDAGQVWRFNWEKQKWYKLPDERVT